VPLHSAISMNDIKKIDLNLLAVPRPGVCKVYSEERPRRMPWNFNQVFTLPWNFDQVFTLRAAGRWSRTFAR